MAGLPDITARLTYSFGTADLLIPAEDGQAIQDALHQFDHAGERLRSLDCAGADQCFVCEARGVLIPRPQPGDGACCLATSL